MEPEIIPQRIDAWLRDQESNIERFRVPVRLAEVAREIGVDLGVLRDALGPGAEPRFHVWSHKHGGRARPSKPYVLRPNGPDTVGIDWEDSVVGAAEAEFKRGGYRTNRELGTEAHIEKLLTDPDVERLRPGTNLRDFWAVKSDGKKIDLWIVEAKGKETFEFAHYCLAEALGQLFRISSEPLTALLGSKKPASHGLCWKIAQQLLKGWQARGFSPTITLGLLVPEWAPDVVWSGGRVTRIEGAFYQRPLAALRKFLETGETEAHTGRSKYLRAFGQVLEGLEGKFGVRGLFAAQQGLRFRILATTVSPSRESFKLIGM